jgi:hypothetical protein
LQNARNVTALLLSSLLTLFPAAPRDVYVPSQQPGCPWNQEALTLLWPRTDPTGGQVILASNAALWFRVNDGVSPIGIAEPVLLDEFADPVEVIKTRTMIPTGEMLELRPRAQLIPGNRYTVQFESTTLPIIASGPIFLTPDRAQIQAIMSITNAPNNSACDTSGILVTPQDDGVELHLFIDDNEDVLAVSSDRAIIVVGTERQEVCGRIVSMDAAGRRSEASDRKCANAGSPPPAVLEMGGRNRGPLSSCQNTEGSGGAAIILALFSIVIARTATTRARGLRQTDRRP